MNNKVPHVRTGDICTNIYLSSRMDSCKGHASVVKTYVILAYTGGMVIFAVRIVQSLCPVKFFLYVIEIHNLYLAEHV